MLLIQICFNEKMNIRTINLQSTDSTNNFLRGYVMDDNDDIVVVKADYQTAGRGQGVNKWESEDGKNLLFSLLVRPHTVPVTSQFILSMTMAVALKETLDSYAKGFELKWPNDIYWHNSKISGTLIETTVSGKGLGRCIFGVGINVNQQTFTSDAPNPVSLSAITGQEEDITELLNKVVEAFCKYYKMLAAGRYAEISDLYHAALYRRRGFHAYRDADGTFDASIVEIEDDGHLVLRDRDCRLRRYAFKEVQFLL